MFKKVFLFIHLAFAASSFAANFGSYENNIFQQIDAQAISINDQRYFENKLANMINRESDLVQTFQILERWLYSESLHARINNAGILMRVIEKKQHQFYSGRKLCAKKIEYYDLLRQTYNKLNWDCLAAGAAQAKSQWIRHRDSQY